MDLVLSGTVSRWERTVLDDGVLLATRLMAWSL
jgi:hypothetical protein